MGVVRDWAHRAVIFAIAGLSCMLVCKIAYNCLFVERNFRDFKKNVYCVVSVKFAVARSIKFSSYLNHITIWNKNTKFAPTSVTATRDHSHMHALRLMWSWEISSS